ncbi:hypothetical protein [Anabaena subtropica]|uniref:Uncharacterized protein n=1 Tax=Anabaena subtropica FACHB-260 TaxID=2692884 RepID=A0ABR8CIH6_9NOST|nr:hypothetical protein [Anabaena subtropica]MBD2343007.1 hypothetical protein [Anabaena subtropica FACHB-260]
MSHQIPELTLETQANIIGGVNLSITNNTDKNLTQIRIDKGSARIRVNLGEVSPNQNFRSQSGDCRSYFDEFTGQFTFSCSLRDSSGTGENFFPSL